MWIYCLDEYNGTCVLWEKWDKPQADSPVLSGNNNSHHCSLRWVVCVSINCVKRGSINIFLVIFSRRQNVGISSTFSSFIDVFWQKKSLQFIYLELQGFIFHTRTKFPALQSMWDLIEIKRQKVAPNSSEKNVWESHESTKREFLRIPYFLPTLH